MLSPLIEKSISDGKVKYINIYFTFYYHYKLLYLFRQQHANSKENICKPRGPQHINYYIVVIKKMLEREMKYTEE